MKDLVVGGQVRDRVATTQSKTSRPVSFEVTLQTRRSLEDWLASPRMVASEHLFPSRMRSSPHLSTRQYACIVKRRVSSIGLDPNAYGTHSMRRAKAALIYQKTGDLRAVQLLLGHTKMDSAVRYLGIEIEDALAIAESVEL